MNISESTKTPFTEWMVSFCELVCNAFKMRRRKLGNDDFPGIATSSQIHPNSNSRNVIHLFRDDACNEGIFSFSSFPWSQFINQHINQSFKSWTWSKSSGTSRAPRVFSLRFCVTQKARFCLECVCRRQLKAFMRKSLQTYSWPYCQCWDRSFSYLLFNNIFLKRINVVRSESSREPRLTEYF